MSLDLFRFLIIQASKALPGITLCPQQLVKLCLDGLSIAVLRALNEQCHAQRDQSNGAMEIEGLAVENRPEYHVNDDTAEGRGTRHPCACRRKEVLQRLLHRFSRPIAPLPGSILQPESTRDCSKQRSPR